MSFGYSVGDVLAVIALANKIRKDFVGAPEQFKSISQDVRSLSIVLQDADANLDNMSEEHAANFNEIVATCQTLLDKLEIMISKWRIVSDKSKGKSAQRLWKRLRWEPDEISDLRTQITSKITLLNAFNDQVISHNIAKIVSRNDSNETQAMMDWISPIDYIPQQNHLVSRLQANSRRWLFDSAEYQNWEQQKGRILFCPGDPGTGKTFTTAIVLETLRDQTQDKQDVLNTFVYCTYQVPDQDVHGLICSLLRNSLQQAADIPDAILSQCRRKQSAKQALLRDETIKHLETLYSSFQKVTLLVDALDEVPTEVSRPFITEILKLQRICQLSLFVTSRHIPEIQNQFIDHGAAILEIRGSDKDIRQFLNDSIFQLPRFVARDPTFQIEIVERITEASSGMFLLAELHLRSLKNRKSPKALRSSLAKLSVGSDAYDSAYQDAMMRIAGLGPESEALAKQALLILIFAREPLSTADLVYALSIEPDSETIDDENVPDIEDVAGVCAGLIVVDQDSNIVRLVHKSAQEYFERHRAQLFPRASDTMARLCMKYVSLATSTPGFDKSDEASWPPFWRYADMNWAYHSRCAEGDDEVIKEEDAKGGTSLTVSNLHSVSTLAIDLLARDTAGGLPSALERACREGRHALVELLLTVNDFDLNRQPCITSNESEYSIHNSRKARDGLFLLIKAASKGDDAMVRILLSHGADPNLVSEGGLTALYIAAKNGHDNTVSLLLEQPAIDPDREYDDKTPLLIAAYEGHLKCVRLLLHRVQRNYRDGWGRNAAYLAAEAGRVEVFKELLKWTDIEVDLPGGTNKDSPLEDALNNRNWWIALALIPHSDANSVFRSGYRALNLAARESHHEAIPLLFSRGAQVNAKGRRGWTALHSATMRGDEETIKLILTHPDIDINVCDDAGNTPLMKLLQRSLKWGKRSPRFKQAYPLHPDMGLGSVKLLLSRPELDVNVQNLEGDTALLMAASLKCHDDSGEDSDIFSALFRYPGIHREHRNKLGQTALVLAVKAGSQRVQTIFEETQLIHQFSEVFSSGYTLLSLAAKHEWDGKLKWEHIVDMSPSEFMHRKDSQGKTPKEIREDACKRRYELQQTETAV